MIANSFPGEYLIAVLIALVLVVSFRRQAPRALELGAWVTLVAVCILTVTGNRNPQTRAMTGAAVWGARGILGMVANLSWQATLAWIHDARFAIANLTVFVFALDVFALALVSTRRQASAWTPVTRLGDWMVLPRPSIADPRGAAPSAVDEINRRFNSWGAAAAAAALASSILLLKRLRVVELPRAARGVRGFSLAAAVAWRRVAGGRAQLGEVRIGRVSAASVDAGLSSTRTRRTRARTKAIGPNIVPITLVRKRAAKANAGTTTRKPRKRAVAGAARTGSRIDKNGPAKRPDRLAS